MALTYFACVAGATAQCLPLEAAQQLTLTISGSAFGQDSTTYRTGVRTDVENGSYALTLVFIPVPNFPLNYELSSLAGTATGSYVTTVNYTDGSGDFFQDTSNYNPPFSYDPLANQLTLVSVGGQCAAVVTLSFAEIVNNTLVITKQGVTSRTTSSGPGGFGTINPLPSLPLGLPTSASNFSTSGSYPINENPYIDPPLSGTASWTLTTNGPTLQVTTNSLPTGEADLVYDSQQSTAIGGVPFSGSYPYHWGITTTAPGLDISYYSGEVFGLPCCDGTYLAILKVTDASGTTASQNLNVVITPSQALARFTKAQKAGDLELAQIFRQEAAEWSTGLDACTNSTPELETKYCQLLRIFQLADLASAWYYTAKAKDPADPNYTVIAQPSPPSLTLPTPDSSWTAAQIAFFEAWKSVVLTKEQLIALAQATITCVNRAEGARQAGNMYWEDQQIFALNHYTDLETAQLQQLLAEKTQLKSAFASSGFPSLQVTQDQAQQFSLGIATTGLPSDVQTQLTLLGVDSGGMAFLAKALAALDPSTISGNITFTIDPITGPVQDLIAANSLRYDLNGDGVVNCADLSIVKASFGKKTGQPGFDPRADVNGDGIVNVLDLSLVAKQLPAGTTCH